MCAQWRKHEGEQEEKEEVDQDGANHLGKNLNYVLSPSCLLELNWLNEYLGSYLGFWKWGFVKGKHFY